MTIIDIIVGVFLGSLFKDCLWYYLSNEIEEYESWHITNEHIENENE